MDKWVPITSTITTTSTITNTVTITSTSTIIITIHMISGLFGLLPEQPRPWRKSCERESCYGDRACIYIYIYICIMCIYIYNRYVDTRYIDIYIYIYREICI